MAIDSDWPFLSSGSLKFLWLSDYYVAEQVSKTCFFDQFCSLAMIFV